MAKKFRILVLFISLSLTLCLMSNTYSRYVADTTSDLEVLFAKWQILVNNTDVTDGNSSSITLVPVIEKNANVAANTIAPTSTGYFDIAIDPSNVDVSFNYSVSLGITNENTPDLMITKYAILSSTYKEGDTITPVTLENGLISGTLNYDNTKSFETFTIRVYFEWYEGTNEQMDDAADTAIGNDAAINNTTFKVNANIKFEQKLS